MCSHFKGRLRFGCGALDRQQMQGRMDRVALLDFHVCQLCSFLLHCVFAGIQVSSVSIIRALGRKRTDRDLDEALARML